MRQRANKKLDTAANAGRTARRNPGDDTPSTAHALSSKTAPRRDTVAACPCCGQRLLIRYGVALPPLLADLFDIIWRSGERGVEPEVLAGVFYPGKASPAARRAIAVNVFHLNAKLSSTDVELRSGQGRLEPYRLQRRKSP